MLDDGVQPNEITVPMLPCVAPDETLAFWRALGFVVTYEQRKPYLYLTFRWRGFELHYGRASSNVDASLENTGGCLVMVDAVAPYHVAFTDAMRRTYGKVLGKGLPRITRYRPLLGLAAIIVLARVLGGLARRLLPRTRLWSCS